MVRQVAEQQEIGGLFKAKPFFADKPPYNLFNVYAAVIQFSFAGNLFAVYNFVGNNIGNFRDTVQKPSGRNGLCSIPFGLCHE